MPAGADPELAARLAKQLVDLYARCEADLIAAVARRAARGITQPGWAEAKLAETAALRREAEARLAQLQADLPDLVADTVGRAHQTGVEQATRDLRHVGIDVGFGHTNTAAVDAIARQAAGDLEATHLQILRSTLDAFRAAAVEGAEGVTVGVSTRRQAAQGVLDRLADQGIGGFVDAAGRTWQLDSYAEMVTRTATGRAQVEGALGRYQAAGRDLVIVSDAPQECSVCRPWEGKVLSISGRTTGDAGNGMSVAGTVADATAAGLFHANCRHRLGLVVPGLTRPMHGTADPDGDAARQHQRYLERGVRRWKRRELAALDEDAARRARAKVAQWQGRLREHVDAHDLKRLRYRERVGVAH